MEPKSMPIPAQSYTTAEAASLLGISPSTIRHYVVEGRIQPLKQRAGSALLFALAEIERFRAVPRQVGNPTFSRGK